MLHVPHGSPAGSLREYVPAVCAGMGRAPATALAYMVWCRGWSLADAHAHLTSVRACNPRLVAIRQAACDLLLDGGGRTRVTLGVSRTGLAQRVQVCAPVVQSHQIWHCAAGLGVQGAVWCGARSVLHSLGGAASAMPPLVALGHSVKYNHLHGGL